MKVKIDNKYTVVFDEKTGRLEAERYGEKWRDCVGDNLILAMAQRIEFLERGIARIIKDGENKYDNIFFNREDHKWYFVNEVEQFEGPYNTKIEAYNYSIFYDLLILR
jgi:hypothetical protein